MATLPPSFDLAFPMRDAALPETNSFAIDDVSNVTIRLSEILSALSYALDLTEGQPMGHAINCCVLGMRLADKIGLSHGEKSALYYALLLKDSGCSSNAARVHQIFGSDDLRTKRALKTTDLSRVLEGFTYLRQNAAIGKSLLARMSKIAKIVFSGGQQAVEMVQIRCDRGAAIARDLGFPESTAEAIYSLDEHWNGRGYSQNMRGEEIPLFSRILCLCQTLEVFSRARDVTTAFCVIRNRSGQWFDPNLVRAAAELENDAQLWHDLADNERARELVLRLEPGEDILADDERLTKVCEGFSRIIDAKSPWTHFHSQGVTKAAVGMARVLGLAKNEIVLIQRAALLHDIGKLGVSNAILDKPDKLTEEEFAIVKRHPFYTQRILEQIPSFQEVAQIAGAHHERLDGNGYHQGTRGENLSVAQRLLAVADVYDALSSERPYRAALPRETVMQIIGKDVPHALCATCFEALKQWSATENSL